jgi:hypothetical protein
MPISATIVANSKRVAPNEQQLCQFVGPSGSFYYEVMMMTEAFRTWEILAANKQRTRSQELEHHRCIETFLVHFRNLRDFFYPAERVWKDPKWFDSAVAMDYSPSWDRAASEWKQQSQDEQQRINKLLSHLPYSRASLEHGWPMKEMGKAVIATLSELVKTLPTQRRDWFKPIMDDLGRP